MSTHRNTEATRDAVRIRVVDYGALKSLITWAVLIVAITGASTTDATSQTRSLRVWLDTIDIGLCEEKSFEGFGVWFESASENDTVIGFRREDSVLAMNITLRWDTGNVYLTAPYILTPPQTLFGRFVNKTQFVDSTNGELYVEVSTDPATLRTIIGQDIPLFYLKGRFRESDTPVTMPNGGARVQSIDIEGALANNTGTVRFLPGFVQVMRDTTPEYTATVRTTGADLDTTVADTIDVLVDNLGGKRVDSVGFVLMLDTTSVAFIDTVSVPIQVWTKHSLKVHPNRIEGSFRSDTVVGAYDTLLARVIVQRKTDSAFSVLPEISEIGLNRFTCIGKLAGTTDSVKGAKRSREDTTMGAVDLANALTDNRFTVLREIGRPIVRIEACSGGISGLHVVDAGGRQLFAETWREPRREVEITFGDETPNGLYVLVIRDEKGRISYKQIFQTR